MNPRFGGIRTSFMYKLLLCLIRACVSIHILHVSVIIATIWLII